MKYAKLEAGELIAAPNPLHIGGMKTYNPPGPLYRAAGYLPVEEPPYPEDGGYYESRWEQQEEKIVRVWKEVEAPEEETVSAVSPTADERLAAVESAILAIMGGAE